MLTVTDCEYAPTHQVFPVAAEDVSVTSPPTQNVVGPLAVIVGTGGSGLTVTISDNEVDEQVPFDTVTE